MNATRKKKNRVYFIAYKVYRHGKFKTDSDQFLQDESHILTTAVIERFKKTLRYLGYGSDEFSFIFTNIIPLDEYVDDEDNDECNELYDYSSHEPRHDQ